MLSGNWTSGIFIRDVRYLTIAFLFCFLPLSLSSQKVLKPIYDPPDKRFDNFYILDGEASQTSTCVLIDKKGFFWSGTDEGLYRYDGSRYVRYSFNKERKRSASACITCLFEDPDGNITEIANSVGISNPSNFTKSFRKYFGKSPKDFFKN